MSRKVTPDLVLSDMIMPEMDGIRLLEWMRQYDPEVPVIMVTAIHDISTALEAIRRGAYDYILKPFEKDQLFLGVGRALQHRRLIIENRNISATWSSSSRNAPPSSPQSTWNSSSPTTTRSKPWEAPWT